MQKPILRHLMAVMLAVVCLAAAAAPATAQTAVDNSVQSGLCEGFLQLEQDNIPEIGDVITGLDAGKTAIPQQTLVALLREATAKDAIFVDPRTGEPAEDGMPAGTGLGAKWTDADGREHTAQMLVMGDVTGSGTVNLSQLVSIAGALAGKTELAPLNLRAAIVSGGDTLQLTDLAAEAALYAAGPDITAEQAKEITDNAIALQTGGGTYSADVYSVMELHAGDIIFGMLPGQSSFYTDLTTVEMCEDSYIEMYHRLQMLPHQEYGYREQLGVYEVTQDICVASGFCLANSEIHGTYAGAGGGFQYVIPDYEEILTLIETRDLHE